MSGFERSAPIPGSQGPRRSQMVRYNNAPPPLTPWRAEVLEAQKQLEAAKKGERSRSRSRSREQRKGGGSSSSTLSRKAAAAALKSVAPAALKVAAITPEAGAVLRQARERGEGWYAAVARAAESWETINHPTKRPAGDKQKDQGKSERSRQHEESDKQRKKEGGLEKSSKRREDETEAERQKREEREERSRKEEQQLEQERFERKQREEYEAKAEERRLKAEEERKRVEEEKRRMEELKRQRKERLKGAFAVGGDDDDDIDREAELVRKAAERKKAQEAAEAAPRSLVPLAEAPATSTALALARPRSNPVDPDLSAKLRFEPGLDPAEAFMRLQERKRKGRRAEFGGPPRGCSPWRDGRRGITWDKDRSGRSPPS